MASPYRIVRTGDELAQLRSLVGAGVAPARMLTRARILLKADHDAGGASGAIIGSTGQSLPPRRWPRKSPMTDH